MFNSIDEIKRAVDSGNKVYWANAGYKVIKDNLGQYLIVYDYNGYTIGLTDRDGKILNGRLEQFFTLDDHGHYGTMTI